MHSLYVHMMVFFLSAKNSQGAYKTWKAVKTGLIDSAQTYLNELQVTFFFTLMGE